MWAYVHKDIYESLKVHAEPGEARWESALLRKVIREWLEMKKTGSAGLQTEDPIAMIEQTARRLRERMTPERPIADVTITRDNPTPPHGGHSRSSRRRPRNPKAKR